MPTRSLSSSVLKWPDRETVLKAALVWAQLEAPGHPELLRLGVFGSYARGNWGVGSDLDLIAIVSKATDPFDRRGLAWDVSTLPVPAQIVVYTKDEWDGMRTEGGRFVRTIDGEAIWLLG